MHHAYQWEAPRFSRRAWRMGQARLRGALIAAGVVALGPVAFAQTGPSGQSVPANPFSYTRTTTFQFNDPQAYQPDQFVEIIDAQSCLHTTTGYDSNGNQSSVTKQSCTGA